MLYSFFWVTPRLLNSLCRRFGILCSIFVGRLGKNNNWDEMAGVLIHVKVWLKRSVGKSAGEPTLFFLSQTFPCINTPTISSQLLFLLKRPTKIGQCVPKCRYIKFRRRGITQKKEYTSFEFPWWGDVSPSPNFRSSSLYPLPVHSLTGVNDKFPTPRYKAVWVDQRKAAPRNLVRIHSVPTARIPLQYGPRPFRPTFL